MDRINSVFVSGHRDRLDIRLGIEIDLFQRWDLNYLDLRVRDQNWLGFSVGIEIDLFLVLGSQLASFLYARFLIGMGGRNILDFSVGGWTLLNFSAWIGIDLVLCRSRKYLVLVYGSKLSSFLCRRIEIDLILEWGLDFSGGVEINLIFMCGGSNLTSFWCWYRNWLVFGAGARNWLCANLNWLVLSVWSVDLVFCVGGRNWIDFWMRATNRLV